MSQAACRCRLRGMSLAELVVAGAIFFVVMGAILGIVPSSAFLEASAERRAQANLLCQSMLEEYREKPYVDLAVGGPWDYPSRTAHNTEFRGQIEIRAVPPHSSDNLVELVATVSWKEGSREKSLIRSMLRNRLQR